MRVLHTLDTFIHTTENWLYPQILAPGVESRAICSLITNLDKYPIERARLFYHFYPKQYALGIPRIFDRLACELGKRTISELRLSRWKPHIIHAHFGPRGWDALRLKKRVRSPLITSFYGYDAWLLPTVDASWREKYRDLFMIGDLFLVEGPAMKERIVELGCPSEKIQIHRIGVDLSTLEFSEKDILRQLRIIMVGRFAEKKGLVDGLRACSIARARGVKLSVTIVGDASLNDPVGEHIKEELKTIAQQPELNGLVEFVGFVSQQEARKIIATHDIFLSPSKHSSKGDAEGGSPVVLTEAMAMGLICIGTRHCDIPEVILNGLTGFLCNEGDVESIADILCNLSGGASDTKSITQAGKKHISDNFCQEVQLSRLIEIYNCARQRV
jgi:colanic acid/amylovoran biosynthesis glycosyltransferase